MESKAQIEAVAEAELQFAHFSGEVSKANTVVDFVATQKRNAQRLARRGYVAAEDCLEDTTYYIKRHPWPSVGIATCIGAGAGLFVGWMFSRASVKNAKTARFQALER